MRALLNKTIEPTPPMPSIRGLYEFFNEVAPTPARSPFVTAELQWQKLQEACNAFARLRESGSDIVGQRPIPTLAAAREMLPELGRIVDAQSVGVDISSTPLAFIQMLRRRRSSNTVRNPTLN